MVAAQNYYNVYLIAITAIYILFVYSKYANMRKGMLRVAKEPLKFSLVLFLVVTLFIGLRPFSGEFVDTMNYVGKYYYMEGIPFSFETDTDNIIFDNILPIFASYRLGCSTFFLLIATIYFGGMLIICRKYFPQDTFAVFVVALSAFETFAAGTNGIKSGAAASLFLIALAYRENLFVSVSFVLLALGFHHSMQVLVAAYICTLLFHKPKWYFVFWVACLCISMAHITYFQNLFAGFTDEHGAEYLIEGGMNWGGQNKGFRLDFVLYSLGPIIMGWYSVVKKKISSDLYNILLCTYIFTNAIWMLCMYASYNNRIAYLSWFMYPFVLVYPCFCKDFGKNRYKTFVWVASAHLAFTLAMHIIYY